jgi:hypothetical protein
MARKPITVSTWRVPTGTEVSWFNPTWPEVVSLIRQLDGGEFCDLTIENPADSGHEMYISGGNEGRYIVVIQKAEKGYRYLTGTGKSTTQLAVVSGGLEKYHPSTQVHKIRIVLQAAKHFFNSATADRMLSWAKEGNDR